MWRRCGTDLSRGTGRGPGAAHLSWVQKRRGEERSQFGSAGVGLQEAALGRRLLNRLPPARSLPCRKISPACSKQQPDF